MSNRWYDLSPEETAKKASTDPVSGLSQSEAKRRAEANGPNRIFPIPDGSVWDYVRKLSVSTLSVLLAFSCIPAAVAGNIAASVILLCTLAVSYVAITVVYIKAQRVLARMGRLALPTAKVLRDGKMTLIRQENVVFGDIICLSAGDIVPCDARLIEDNNLIVLEAGITEANGPVRKDSEYCNIRKIRPHEAINMVYASTIVQSGSGKAIACRTGKSAYVCVTGKNKPAASYDRLAVFDRLHRVSFFATLVAILLTFCLTVVNMLPGLGKFGPIDGLLYALAFGCGAMTEFYAIFGYIIVAVGVFGSLGQSGSIATGALIKNAEKLDAMCAVDTVIIPPEAAAAAGDISLDCLYIDNPDDLWRERTAAGGFDGENFSTLLKYAVITTGLYGGRLISLNVAGDNVYTGEEEAIIRSAEASGLYNSELDLEYPLREHLGKSDYCPFETSLVKHNGNNAVIVRGFADDILAACNRYRDTDGRIRSMSPVARSRFSTIAAQMTRDRGIVIAIAANRSVYTSLVRLSDTLSDMVFEGFLGFSEPLLSDVAQTVAACRDAGINVVLFTPEHTERGKRIARAMGLLGDSDSGITDSEAVQRLSDRDLAKLIPEISVYEDMDARTERRVIKLMREAGHKVGFLGMRFEEITAMREADISYTQSITLSDKKPIKKKEVGKAELPISISKAGGGAPVGCDALRFVSDVIISTVSKKDSSGGMNALLSSLRTARMIYFNIGRLMTYLLTVNTARLLILLYTFFSGLFLLTPVQMLVCGLIYDLAAVMIISFERPTHDILYEKPADGSHYMMTSVGSCMRAVLSGVILGAGGIILGLLLIACSAATATTVCSPVFILMLLSSVIILLESGRSRSLFYGNITVSNMLITVVFSEICLIACGLISENFGKLFGIYRTGWQTIPGIILLIALLLTTAELGKRGKNKPKSYGKK